jgi:hypothetical protein
VARLGDFGTDDRAAIGWRHGVAILTKILI